MLNMYCTTLANPCCTSKPRNQKFNDNPEDFVSLDHEGYVGIKQIASSSEPTVKLNWKNIEHFFTTEKKSARDLYFQLASVEIEDREKPKLFKELKTLADTAYRHEFKQKAKTGQYGDCNAYAVGELSFSIQNYDIDPKTLEQRLQKNIDKDVRDELVRSTDPNESLKYKPSLYEVDAERYLLTTHIIEKNVVEEFSEVQAFLNNERSAVESTLSQRLQGTIYDMLLKTGCEIRILRCPGRCKLTYKYSRLIPEDTSSPLKIKVESYKDFCFSTHEQRKEYLEVPSEQLSVKSMQILLTMEFRGQKITVTEVAVKLGNYLDSHQLIHIFPQTE
ncbi:hypothetical protein D5018_19150 [Parashewanella curva]|uniref:Uncharacterized protein n=1 Tax=Parashewanella curva TaxID=2338552 RepID=A0A3L8PRS1_9GAMM|nr:hypothetical protein [Parashewanella curva]RLV58091.1 hypothetical protein D5018_19150 [Parashewanella curva]